MPSGRGQLLGVFYATPANSIRAGADALIAASRGAIVPKPASTAYTGSGYTLTLPGGWTAKKTSSGTPLLSSADGQAVVSVNEQDLAVTPTDVELRKQIADTTSVLGKSLKVTFSVANRPITIGALHVLTGVLTASNHSIGVEVSYLSDGQHLLLILELYPSGTPQADLDQATALIGSIVVTGGGAFTTSSPTPTPEATPAGTPAPQTGAGSADRRPDPGGDRQGWRRFQQAGQGHLCDRLRAAAGGIAPRGCRDTHCRRQAGDQDFRPGEWDPGGERSRSSTSQRRRRIVTPTMR